MRKVKSFGFQTVVLLVFQIACALLFGFRMGLVNFFSTIMATAHNLLLNTVFFIMAITVLSGAFGSFLAEFGIINLLQHILSPVVKLLWSMPGTSAIGALSTYISDNPAIIALSKC